MFGFGPSLPHILNLILPAPPQEQQRRRALDAELPEPPVPPDAGPAQPKFPRRTQSALQVYRSDWLRERRSWGEVHNPASGATWELVRKDFDGLEPHLRAYYEEPLPCNSV